MLTDENVFREEYVPDVLEHRNQELSQFATAVKPDPLTDCGDDILLSGPSGVGKTVSARYLLEDLRYETGVASAHIRCVSQSDTGVVYHAVHDHPRETAVHRNTPHDELLEWLREIVTDPYVVVLDEADGLPETDILSTLQEIPHLSVVVIVHEPAEWLDRFTSTPHFEHIPLERYSTPELRSILATRADHGLQSGVVTTEQLHWIAEETAGIARDGIQSLHAAAVLAQDRSHDRIRERDIADGFELAKEWIRKSNLRSLSFGHKIVYEIVRASVDELSGPEIYEEYDAIASSAYRDRDEDPVGERMVRNYLDKLAEYDLVEAEGKNRWRRYEIVDPELSSGVAEKMTWAVENA